MMASLVFPFGLPQQLHHPRSLDCDGVIAVGVVAVLLVPAGRMLCAMRMLVGSTIQQGARVAQARSRRHSKKRGDEG
jgi:hypothetical protein